MLEWLVLALESCKKVTKIFFLIVSLADSKATPSHFVNNQIPLFHSQFFFCFFYLFQKQDPLRSIQMFYLNFHIICSVFFSHRKGHRNKKIYKKKNMQNSRYIYLFWWKYVSGRNRTHSVICASDILKVEFFARSELNFWNNCARKCMKNTQKVT